MTFVKTAATDDAGAALLAAHPWFSGLPAEAAARLAARCERIGFVAGQTLFHEGDPARRCLFLESGEVAVSRHTADGEEKVFGQFAAGDFVAVAAVFMPRGLFPMTARARVGGRALAVPEAALRELCREQPDFAFRLLRHFAARLEETVDRVDRLTSSSAAQRVADDLVRLCREQGDRRVRLPFSRAQWAATLGIRYEILSRLLSAWRRRGAISGRGDRLDILDSGFLDRVRDGGS